jgi:hypothetical protein
VQVTFRKLDRRYEVEIARERGAPLVPRGAPGFDPDMPHDLAHFLVEEQFEIRLGIFGQLAAGGGGMFAPHPRDRTGCGARSAQRLNAIGRADSLLSERLVQVCVTEWRRRSADGVCRPAAVPGALATDDEIDSAVARLQDVAAQWRALPVGGALTLTWPDRLVFDAAGSRQGRKPVRR